MHARIAILLGWTLAEVQSFSLQALREMVRGAPPSEEREALLEELNRWCAPGAAILRRY